MKTFTYILLYVWQFLQNIAGMIMVTKYNPQRVHELDNGVEIYYSHKLTGGISLGNYCILNTGHYRKDMNESLKRDTVRNKAIGYTKLSRIFGPLYLLIILLPQADKWADTLGGVKR